jgi:hypothetical protein
MAPAIATAHTGTIVIRNGRIESLAEFACRSKAWKTMTVPASKRRNARASQAAVGHFTRGSVLEVERVR